MNCTKCGKEISSSITGELCTTCFFKRNKDESGKDIDPIGRSGGDNSGATEVNSGIGKTEKSSVEDAGGKKDCSLNHDKLRKELIDKGMIGICPECNEVLTIEEDLVHSPSQSKNANDKGIKYCQFCIERGIPNVIATREWTPGFFICDDCFEPLINNILNPTDEDVRKIKDNPMIDSDKPLLNQFYSLFSVPENLRFQSIDITMRSRDAIFNYHAPAVVNKDVKEVASELEQMQIILFYIKVSMEPKQDYINRAKETEREKNKLTSIEKGKTEFSKSKTKTSQDQKMADVLFKNEPNEKKRLEKYLEFQKQAREKEFKSRTGT